MDDDKAVYEMTAWEFAQYIQPVFKEHLALMQGPPSPYSQALDQVITYLALLATSGQMTVHNMWTTAYVLGRASERQGWHIPSDSGDSFQEQV